MSTCFYYAIVQNYNQMNYDLLIMEIIKESEGSFTIKISKDKDTCLIEFSPDNKELRYVDNSTLTHYLKLREFQLRKLLHNKRKESFYKGFKLKFVLHDGLPDVNFYDRTKITVLDNLKNQFIVKKTKTKTESIPELFTDGSFNHEKQIGGYAFLLKIDNERYIHQVKTKAKGNNIIELLAVIKGLEYLKGHKRLRIITDSQYVIKGITEWLPIWKINDFFTANGTQAKNIDEWKKADKLIENKYIEFEWVKSHSEHFENTICDMKAKTISNSKD